MGRFFHKWRAGSAYDLNRRRANHGGGCVEFRSVVDRSSFGGIGVSTPSIGLSGRRLPIVALAVPLLAFGAAFAIGAVTTATNASRPSQALSTASPGAVPASVVPVAPLQAPPSLRVAPRPPPAPAAAAAPAPAPAAVVSAPPSRRATRPTATESPATVNATTPPIANSAPVSPPVSSTPQPSPPPPAPVSSTPQPAPKPAGRTGTVSGGG
jgi:hypothetical protein